MDSLVDSISMKLESWQQYRASSDWSQDELVPAEVQSRLPKDMLPLVAMSELLGADGVQGKKVVVFGTMDPWAEGLALAMGAAHVTTVHRAHKHTHRSH